MEKRVSKIIDDNQISLDENCRIIWKNNIIARLKKGNNYLNPEIEVLADDALDYNIKSKLEIFLKIGSTLMSRRL